MVFRPNSHQEVASQSAPQQQSFLPPQPVYQCVQPQESGQIVQQPQNNYQQHPLSQTTTNDEIAELLVSVLEEITQLKQALLTDSNQDVEELLKKDTPQIENKAKEEELVAPKPPRALDFSNCF